MHIAHAVLRRDISEVACPGDAAGTLELGEGLLRIAAHVAVGRVVYDEVELWPVLGRLANIGHIRESTQVGKFLLYARCEKALVDTDVLDPCLHHLLVPLVGDLLVVHAPGIAADILVGVVTDRIALATIRLDPETRSLLIEHTRFTL